MSAAEYTEEQAKQKATMRQAAEAEAKALAGDDIAFVWVASNRTDDQVVLHERDDAHPGGECFVGGPGVDYCAKTPLVERFLREGLLVETGEPPDGPRTPLITPAGTLRQARDVPGQPSRLGRQIDPDLVGDPKKLAQQQERAPDDIPVPSQVEKAPEPTEPQNRTRR